MRSNVGPTGTLDNDKLLRALLQLRNTPDPDCNVSPAQIIFGRPIRDAFSFVNRLEKFSNPAVLPTWREAWSSKEAALRTRFTRSSEVLSGHAKTLPPLAVGERCFIQNQTGKDPTKWHHTGVVVEVLQHDQYLIKVDGSGRVTKRNRRFLRAFKPASMNIQHASPLGAPPGPIADHCSPAIGPGTSAPAIPEPTEMLVPHDQEDSVPMLVTPSSEEFPLATSHPDVQPAATPAGVPAALKRLLPFNSAGRKEAITAPEDGGRPRRAMKS